VSKGLIESHPSLREMTRSAKEQQQQQQQPRLSLQQIQEHEHGRVHPQLSYRGDYWYSKMLTNASFWKAISMETPYALTLQSDTLLCRPFPTQEFISRNESFLGGISGFKREAARQIPVIVNPQDDSHSTNMKYKHLNGGLKLRNIAWTIECIRQYNDMNPNGWSEDSLYRHCRESEINGTVHINEVQAYSFASDNGITLYYTLPPMGRNGSDGGERRHCPVGVHKPWVKGVKKWGTNAYRELVEYCPGLDLHEQLCTMERVKTDNGT
jgi:hypothetical protein